MESLVLLVSPPANADLTFQAVVIRDRDENVAYR